jgi:hypothetical protein
MSLPKSWLETQYDAGRQFAGSGTPNPWKQGTDCWNAWDQGRRGVTFSIVDQPAEPKPVKPASLFD